MSHLKEIEIDLRTVPEKITIDSWNKVQKNIGKFQRFLVTRIL